MREMAMGATTNPNRPPAGHWETDLEVDKGRILAQADMEYFLADWVGNLPGRQATVLCVNLGEDASAALTKKRDALRAREPELLPYLLVAEFAKGKSKVAVASFGENTLSDELLEVCRKNEDEYDTTAVLFAIYHNNWRDLRKVFHLERIQRTGFARMSLNGTVRKPDKPLAEYLQPRAVRHTLATFDQEKGDGLTSELRDVIVEDGRHMVFIRRGERPDLIVRDGGVVHGYRPEWIILDFDDDGKHLNISSKSTSVPLEIANRLAYGYFGIPCEYDNETKVTYTAQLEAFLTQLRNDHSDTFSLVELVVTKSPLEDTKLLISSVGSIGTAIEKFEQAVGLLLGDIGGIYAIKVGYRNKRVTLKFEHLGVDQYVVRYTDHRLNAMERRTFEAEMKQAHEIPVLSTEKRFKHQ